MTRRKRNPTCIFPDEVIDAILVRLPIREAVRTSTLSSNWKFKCQNMSKLLFNDECLPPSTNPDNILCKLVYIVDSVLTLHEGLVQRFELTGVPSCSDVNRWLTFLSRKQVKEIILRFIDSEPYSVPSCIFSCETLTHLELHDCVLKIPASFQKFPKLTTLILSEFSDPGGRLEVLISGCPLLRKLSLVVLEIKFPGPLNIISPNLHEVYIRGVFYDLSFGNAPYLTKATFWLDAYNEKIKSANLLSSLPNIQKLQLVDFALQWFRSYGRKLERFHLKSFHVDVEILSEVEFKVVLGLIRNFPNLEVLNIQVSSVKSAATITSSLKPKNCDLTLNHLKIVKMAGLIGTVQELHLIKCILIKAPLLETITISINHSEAVIDDSEIFMHLMRHRRASAQAEIIYKTDLVLISDDTL